MKKLLAVALTLLAVTSFAQQPAFLAQLAAIRRELREATHAKDHAATQRLLLQMDRIVPGRSDTAYNLACAYALVGDKDQALRSLERFAAMGAVADAAADPDLASLTAEPRFGAVLSQIEENRRPVSRSRAFATLPDLALLAEDITHNPRTGDLFVTSILKKKVLRVHQGRVTDFADLSRDPGWPLMAVHADAARGVLWVTASAMPDFAASPQADYGKALLLKLDLRTGKILQRIAPPDSEQRSLGDMDIAPNGDVLVTDSRGAAVYLLPHGASTLRRLDRGEFVSPQTPAVSPDGRFAYIADYARGIARMDLRSNELIWLKHPDTVSLAGTDGLALAHDKRHTRLIAVQNGFNPARVVSLTLGIHGDQVEALDVLEANYPDLGDPTHAVRVGNELYFIANSGWTFLDAKGNVKPATTMTPAIIRKLQLP